jgi:type IV pilus assembly protein PilM
MALRSAVGIDLGSHSIKVVELRISEDAAIIRRALYLDHAALRARGVDPADRPAVALLLKKEMTAAGIPVRDVVLGISGKDSIIRYTHVPPVPAWRLKKIMDYEVGEVEEKIGEKLTSDYRVLPVTRESDEDQSIIIGLAKEASLEGLLADLGAAGFTVAKAVPAPIALYAVYSALGPKPDLENPEDELVVVIDLGAENLSMAFILNGNLAFARSASFGGKNFTEVIARDLEMDLERAEAAKLRSGSLESSAGHRDDMVNPLRGAAAQLLSTVGSSVKFGRSQTGVRFPDPARFAALGGALGLPGLVSYLQSGLNKPVEVFHPAAAPSKDIGGDAGRVLAAAPGNFGVALGLAVAGMRDDGIELSLLPSRYVEKRAFRERTLFLYLAAAFLLVFLGLRLVGGFGENAEARSRRTELEDIRKHFDAASTELHENSLQNIRTRARANRVLREAEVTPFQAFVLDFLGKRVGAELKITSIKLLAAEVSEDGPVYQVVVDGSADNASLKAVDHIKALQTALAGEARIAKVEVASMAPEGNTYKFQMVLTPSYPAYR